MVMLILVLLGLCLGSFTNALVWRLHRQQGASEKKAKSQEYSVLRGRSMCPHCKHRLEARDLVPVISWVALGGKCRYCGKPIFWQYPAVEILMALLFVLSYLLWPEPLDSQGTVEFCLWLVYLVGFVALAVYDLRWMLLPNRIVFPLVGLAAVQRLVDATYYGGGLDLLLQVFLSTLIAGGIFFLIFQVSKGKWIGGGDVKLGIFIGILLGSPELSILMLFVASSLGSLYTVPLMAAGKLKRNAHVPFGPFLIAGTIIVKLFGERFIDWYLTNVGV